MAFTKEELKQIGEVVIEVTMPMFEQIFERFGGVDERLDSIEREFRDFREETRQRFATIEKQLNTIDSRLENVDDDVRHLYKLIEKAERGTPGEKSFARRTLKDQLPLIHKYVHIVSQQQNIPLPKL